jgi:type 1 glutamine amidotransferase
MKNILLISDGFFHPPFRARRMLRSLLAEMDDFSFRHTRSLEKLPEMDLEQIHALVIYVHHKTISGRALAILDSYVQRGGGVLGIHTATASFKDCAHYFEILGGRFSGHGPVAPFDVQPVAGRNEPFEDIPGFTVKDELYLHELQPGIRTHFTALHEGKPVPVVWTYPYGKGRVCYAVPGHLADAFRQKAYRQILKRGLAWVSA